MVNKKLADWIKSEEAQGYTEQQLKNYLIKKKYNKKDIEDAVDDILSGVLSANDRDTNKYFSELEANSFDEYDERINTSLKAIQFAIKHPCCSGLTNLDTKIAL